LLRITREVTLCSESILATKLRAGVILCTRLLVSHLHVTTTHELLLFVELLLSLKHLLLEGSGCISRVVRKSCALYHWSAWTTLELLVNLRKHLHFAAEVISLLHRLLLLLVNWHLRVVTLIKENSSVLGIVLATRVTYLIVHLLLVLLLLAKLSFNLSGLIFGKERLRELVRICQLTAALLV